MVVPPGLLLLKQGGMQMDTYQTLTLLFVAGGFLIALLTYIDKRKIMTTRQTGGLLFGYKPLLPASV